MLRYTSHSSDGDFGHLHAGGYPVHTDDIGVNQAYGGGGGGSPHDDDHHDGSRRGGVGLGIGRESPPPQGPGANMELMEAIQQVGIQTLRVGRAFEPLPNSTCLGSAVNQRGVPLNPHVHHLHTIA